MKTRSTVYAGSHSAARKKASRRYKKTSRIVTMIKLARGPKRGRLKPYAVFTMKRKR